MTVSMIVTGGERQREKVQCLEFSAESKERRKSRNFAGPGVAVAQRERETASKRGHDLVCFGMWWIRFEEDQTRPDQSHSWVYYYVITTTGSDNYYLWPRV